MPPPAVWVVEHGGVEAVVAAGVFAQVVAPHEALGAERAGEALLAGVCAEVAGQLIRAGELLGAVGPGALERPLTCMHAQVRLQVRRLAVHLPAARLGAPVPLLGGRATLVLAPSLGRFRRRARAAPVELQQDPRDHEQRVALLTLLGHLLPLHAPRELNVRHAQSRLSRARAVPVRSRG